MAQVEVTKSRPRGKVPLAFMIVKESREILQFSPFKVHSGHGVVAQIQT